MNPKKAGREVRKVSKMVGFDGEVKRTGGIDVRHQVELSEWLNMGKVNHEACIWLRSGFEGISLESERRWPSLATSHKQGGYWEYFLSW